MGFYPGVMADDVLETVVDYTEKSGDLRVGIDLLKRSGLSAEKRASKSISARGCGKLLRALPAGSPHLCPEISERG